MTGGWRVTTLVAFRLNHCPSLPLAAKCAKLSADVGALQAEAGKQIAALKDVLARELRKQKVDSHLPGAFAVDLVDCWNMGIPA